MREHRGSSKGARGNTREHRRVKWEQKHEAGLSAGVMWRCYIFETRGYYIYIIYTPNLGLGIPGREREQGRFRGSNEGARREHRGSKGEHRGSTGAQQGSMSEHEGAL